MLDLAGFPHRLCSIVAQGQCRCENYSKDAQMGSWSRKMHKNCG